MFNKKITLNDYTQTHKRGRRFILEEFEDFQMLLEEYSVIFNIRTYFVTKGYKMTRYLDHLSE